MSTTRGTYFDGQVARPVPVTLDFDGGIVHVRGENIDQSLPVAELRVSDRLGNVPRFLYLPGSATVETADNAAIDAALAGQRSTAGARIVHSLESRQWIAVAGCFIIAVLVALFGYYAPPALARVVAQKVPPQVDRKLGDASLAAIKPYFTDSALSAEQRARVQAQLDRVEAGGGVPHARLEFLAMKAGFPNAFALPGNVIVITDALVELPASDDELAAVLAHELGHLEKRHGVQSLLRSSMTVLVVAAVTGDSSALTSFAATIPISILTAGYARDLEREADRYARDLLVARGIPLRSFVGVLVRLDEATKTIPRTSTYLATHPETDERIALFGGASAVQRRAILAQPWLEKGKAALDRYEHATALVYFSDALKADPQPQTYILRARAEAGKADYVAADTDLKKARELDPKSVEALVAQGEIRAVNQVNYAGALRAAQEALALDPKSGPAAAVAGYAEMMQGDLATATVDLDHAVAWAPEAANGWAYHGMLNTKKEDYPAALADYDRALLLNPHLEWVHSNRGWIRFHQNDLKGAMADFDAVTGSAFRNADFYYGRASAKMGLRDLSGAIADYSHALECKPPVPTQVRLLVSRGVAFLRQEQFRQAVDDCDAALKLDPHSGLAYFNRALCRRTIGDPEQGLDDLRQAEEYGLAHDEILPARAMLQFEIGHYDEAMADITAQLAGSAHPSMLLLQRGWVETCQRRLDEAEADFTKSIQLDGSGDSARYGEMYRFVVRRLRSADGADAEFPAKVAGWPEGWARTLGRYLADQITEDELFAEAAIGEKPSPRERRCEAGYFAGMMALVRGDIRRAEADFLGSVRTRVRHFAEYKMAKGELDRIWTVGGLRKVDMGGGRIHLDPVLVPGIGPAKAEPPRTTERTGG
jgi:predicted Zn-dependent protease